MRTLFALLLLANIPCLGQPRVHIDSTLNCFRGHKQKEARTIDEHRTLLHMRCKTDTGKVDVFIDRDDRTPEYGTFIYKDGRPMKKSKIVSYKGHWLKKFFQVLIVGTNEVWEYSFLTHDWNKRPRQWHTGDSNSTERPH